MFSARIYSKKTCSHGMCPAITQLRAASLSLVFLRDLRFGFMSGGKSSRWFGGVAVAILLQRFRRERWLSPNYSALLLETNCSPVRDHRFAHRPKAQTRRDDCGRARPRSL